MDKSRTQVLSEEIHFSEYIRVIRKRSTLFLFIFALVAAIGVIYTSLIEPVYQTDIRLEILDAPEDEFSILNTLGGYKKDRIETEIEKIKSRDIAREVAENLDLKNTVSVVKGSPEVDIAKVISKHATQLQSSIFFVVFHDSSDTYSVLTNNKEVIFTGRDPAFSSDKVSFDIKVGSVSKGDMIKIEIRHIESCVRGLMERTEVFRIGETSIVGISVKDRYPIMTKRIVDEYFKVYSRRNLEEKNASAREVNKFISERKAFYKDKKEQASDELQFFKEKNNIFSLDSKNSSLVTQMAMLESRKAIKTVEVERIDHAVSMVQANEDEFVTPEIFSPQSGLEQLSAQLSMLQIERKMLLNSLTLDHPRVVDIKVQIGEIKKAIIEKWLVTKESIKAEMKSLGNQIAKYDDEVALLPQLDKEMVEKLRDVKFYEEMELQMATKFEEFSIIAASTLSSIRISQKPIVPLKPIKPNKTVNIIFAVVLAAVIGIAIVFVLEYFDNAFVSTEEVERELEEKVLVTIPYLRKRFREDVSFDKEAGLAYLSPDSPLTESFRTLKTSLEFLDSEKSGKVFQITSSIAGEGKSTVAVNLAITFANSGLKTLIIDGDYKRPMQHKMLGLENVIGFSDVIYKGVSAAETIQDTSVNNLFLISSGMITRGSMQSIPLQDLHPLFDELREKYDYIIVDTPPLMVIDDSIRIGRAVDGLLLMVGLGHVDKEIVKRSIEKCGRNEIPLCGVVVNDFKETEKYSRNYKYYHYDYYFRRHPRKTVINNEKKWRLYIKK